MFKKYVEELSKETNQVEEEITMYETLLREKKEVLRDLKSGLQAMEKLQGKYVKEEDETVTNSNCFIFFLYIFTL